jgi:integrase
VLDGVLAVSPADHVRRPNVPPESPTLGLTHLQFEAMLTAGKTSGNINDFALVAMLGLLGLRIFEACGANVEDLGEEHGHRVLKVRGKGGKVVLTPLAPAVQRAIERAGRPHQRTGPAHQPGHQDGPAPRDPPPATARSDQPRPDPTHAPAHAAAHLRHHHARRRCGPARRADRRPTRRPRTTMRYDRARKNLDRHPNYIFAAYMASGT